MIATPAGAVDTTDWKSRMSNSNGTALPTSTNGAAPDIDTAGLTTWLDESGSGAAPALVDAPASDDAELVALAERVARDRRVAELQRDPARLDRLSDEELGYQRGRVEKLRRARMDLALDQAETDVAQQRRTLAAQRRLRRLAAVEDVWQAKAAARRARLIDPTARMAAIYRTEWVVSRVLMLIAAIGIAWCAVTVGEALDGGLAYSIEPLFSVPLLVIMAMHTRAAANRTTFPPGVDRWKIIALELALFAVTTGLQVAAVVPKLDDPGANAGTLLITHLVPPALIVLAVTLQPVVSSFLANLLVSVYVEANVDTRRLSADEANLLDRAREINLLWIAGELRPTTEPCGGPSVQSVMEQLGIAKDKCQAGVAAWRKVYGTDPGHQR